MKYLDTNIIIYAIENHAKYGKKCKKILQDIQDNKLKTCSNILVLVEVINVLTKLNKTLEIKLDIAENINAILNLPIEWYELSFPIIKHASNYNFKVSGVDYIHIATMEINSIFEVITADKEFNKINFLKRVDPLDY
tara:strand:- start:6599 stop:7009 length:411 start_codon:yes stop_codon:yes gene_type:complete